MLNDPIIIYLWERAEASTILRSDFFKMFDRVTEKHATHVLISHYLYAGNELHFYPWRARADMQKYIIDLVLRKYFKKKCTYINPFKHYGFTKLFILFRYKGTMIITDFDHNLDFVKRSKHCYLNLPLVVEILNSFKYPYNVAFLNLILNDYMKNEHYWYLFLRSYTTPYPYNEIIDKILLENEAEPVEFDLYDKFGFPSILVYANGHSKINWLIFKQTPYVIKLKTFLHVFGLGEYSTKLYFDNETYFDDNEYYFIVFANSFYLKFNSLFTHNFEFSFIFMSFWFFFIVFLFHSSILENLTHSFIFNKLNTSNFFFIKFKNFIEIFKKNRRRRGLKRIYFRFYRINFCKKICYTFKNFFTVSMFLKKMGYEPGFFPAYKEIWKD